MPHRLQYKALEPAPLRRAGRHTDPPKNSVAAVRAAAMPGRRILNAAGAGQGLGSPASADARPAGGARSRGPLWLPRTKYGPRGGGPPGAPLVCSRFIWAGFRRKKRPRRAITRDSIPPLVLRRGPPHIPRMPAPCRPLPWREGGAIHPVKCPAVHRSTWSHERHCDTASTGILDSSGNCCRPRRAGRHGESAGRPWNRTGRSGNHPGGKCFAGLHWKCLRT